MLASRRKKCPIAIAIVLIALIAAYGLVAYNASAENRHRRIDGIVDQVAHYRNRLWLYYLDHGKHPEQLSDLGMPKCYHDTVHFSTQQGLPCVLRINRYSGITKITCGDPVLAEFVIAEDGQIIKKVWRTLLDLFFY